MAYKIRNKKRAANDVENTALHINIEANELSELNNGREHV